VHKGPVPTMTNISLLVLRQRTYPLVPNSTTRTPGTDVVQHHQRTSSQQFYNLLYNKFATSQCQSPTSRHVKMLGIWDVAIFCPLVVNLLYKLWNCCELVRWWCPLVVLYNMSVAGVRVVEFGTYNVRNQLQCVQCTATVAYTVTQKN